MRIEPAQASEQAAQRPSAASMLFILAHELRAPLAPIRNAATLLAMQIPEGTPLWKPVGVIERQVTAIESLIDHVLEAARLEHGFSNAERTCMNLGNAVADAVETVAPYAAEREQTLDLKLPLFPIFVNADAEQMGQIVRNLVTNAVKYTERGGRIEVLATSTGETAEIRVRDTGIGLAPDQLESIFDLYAQAGQGGTPRSAGGLGIGLYVARQLALAHGGNVVASSQGVNFGSEFTVRIPLASA